MTDKTQEFLNKLPINNNYDYSKVKYIHSKIKVEIVCKRHGSFFITPNNHLKGIGCNRCGIISRSSKRRNKNWLDSFRKIHNDIYDYSKVLYVNDKTKVEVICKEHGSFLVKPNNHLQGQRCYKCVFDVYDRETFIDKSNSIFNYLYDYTKVSYINNKTKVEVICKEHGSFHIQPTNHLQGQGCNKCKFSKGEIRISNLLKEKNIKYEAQYRFDDCLNINKLPFDFYLPEERICIEYDGEQHFRPIEYFGGIKSFNKLKERDKIKSEYCLANDIKLIRIPFNKYDEIENILDLEIVK